MSSDLEEIKKRLTAGKSKERPNKKDRGLSTGSVLLNLACSGNPKTGLLKGHYYVMVGDSQSGKAQPLYCKVLTPYGWKKMGDLEVGDDVIDPDGGFGKVIQIHPQRDRKRVHRVVFLDGSSTECCEDHLWLTASANQKRRGTDSVKDLLRIKKDVNRSNAGGGHYIPITSPVVFDSSKSVDLPIHPYLLGVLLGNGHLGNGGIYISSSDSYIIEKIRKMIPEGYRLHNQGNRNDNDYAIVNKKGSRNEIMDKIKDLKLYGKKAHQKFVPKDYLFSSIENRLLLLQGLMDTDGTASGGCSSVEYSTVSPYLMEAVRELVWSLGGTARTTVKKSPKYSYRGEIREGRDCYRVWVKLPEETSTFTLPRKEIIHQKNKEQCCCDWGHRRIMKVEYVGLRKCQCITVSTKRGLYITDDYIVTHNTWLSRMMLAEAAINPRFKDYRLIVNNPERGSLMDHKKFFGKLADRIEEIEPSETLEGFYDQVDDLIKSKAPFIEVLDSEDALSSESEQKKFQQNKKIRRKASDNEGESDEKGVKGSYGDGKAKINSSSLRVAHSGLGATGSILILIKQSRDNIGPDAMFNPKTRSGGRAITFYATLELWFSIKEKIKREVKGKKREIGSVLKVQVKKNRVSGRNRSVDLLFYPSHGIDDVGSCIKFLVDEKHWKGTKERVVAPEFDYSGSQDKLVKMIEENGREGELETIVTQVWNEIEAACAVERKNRYE